MLCLKCLEVAQHKVCALQAFQIRPCGQHWAQEVCLFESVVSSPQTVFIVVPEENVC